MTAVKRRLIPESLIKKKSGEQEAGPDLEGKEDTAARKWVSVK